MKDFQKSIVVGDKIECISYLSWRSSENGEELVDRGIPERLQGARTITYKDTTGFYMRGEKDTTKRGSFCEWPKMRELNRSVDGLSFTITDGFGKRSYKLIK